MISPLDVRDAHWLLQQPFTAPAWIIEDLISTGLHLLVGAPKLGKSWLVLEMGLNVSRGEPFWGFATAKCDVLYLCLEDTFSRIQQRLWRITDEAEPGFNFAIAAEKIPAGLVNQLEEFLAAHPATRLVVIDTFQAVRQANGDNSYAVDYRDLTTLKQFADKHNLAILVVHHTRKMSDSDVFNTVSGTTGITGCADSTFVLEKESRCTNSAKLSLTGRDVEFQELQLRFSDCHWLIVAKTSPEELAERLVPDAVLRVLDFMATHPGAWQGTATGLIADAGIGDVSVAVLGKYLAQHQAFLRERGITYTRRHMRSGNILALEHSSCGEGGDSCEG
ncbi:MAG: AAA family ATPase [Raoultibacter sp.]